MRDDLQGGVLATLIAAPVMIVCGGVGSVALTAITDGSAAWAAWPPSRLPLLRC